MITRLLKAAIDFRGRTRRRHFWLLVLVVVGIIGGLSQPADKLDDSDPLVVLLYILIPIGTLLVVISGIRRLHDVDRRGWWILLVYTLCGPIWLLGYWFTDSTVGPNRFGPDPKNRHPREDPQTIARPPQSEA
ncbi:DUF805 domain-containing protein [Kribbella sp. NBC_01505]|uniref:DUF805 domain-containing protein n=1 Tax=Kribbella sp. NBC_01505 TaxID=2903580 RepID=UPI0038649BC2